MLYNDKQHDEKKKRGSYTQQHGRNKTNNDDDRLFFLRCLESNVSIAAHASHKRRLRHTHTHAVVLIMATEHVTWVESGIADAIPMTNR